MIERQESGVYACLLLRETQRYSIEMGLQRGFNIARLTSGH